MSNTRLPRDHVSTAADWPCCPWCQNDAGDAVLRLGDLSDAWNDGEIKRPWRSAEGAPDPNALLSSCPHCERPFMVALQTGAGVKMVRLLAVRTRKDIEHMGAQWGRPL